MFSKKINRTIENIDKLFDAVDRAQLVFKEGVKNYLYGEMPQLSDSLQTMTRIKSDAEIRLYGERHHLRGGQRPHQRSESRDHQLRIH